MYEKEIQIDGTVIPSVKKPVTNVFRMSPANTYTISPINLLFAQYVLQYVHMCFKTLLWAIAHSSKTNGARCLNTSPWSDLFEMLYIVFSTHSNFR